MNTMGIVLVTFLARNALPAGAVKARVGEPWRGLLGRASSDCCSRCSAPRGSCWCCSRSEGRRHPPLDRDRQDRRRRARRRATALPRAGGTLGHAAPHRRRSAGRVRRALLRAPAGARRVAISTGAGDGDSASVELLKSTIYQVTVPPDGAVEIDGVKLSPGPVRLTEGAHEGTWSPRTRGVIEITVSTCAERTASSRGSA